MNIAERIKYFRKQRGITQEQLAQLSGIHPVSIRKYETNKTIPLPAQIEKIAHALKVSSSAISGAQAARMQFETVGDLMGLLMLMHKSGILTMEGKRTDGRSLDEKTARLQLNPILSQILLIYSKKEKAIPMDDLCIAMKESQIRSDLLRWEGIYHAQMILDEKYGASEKPEEQKALAEMQQELELIEMELQGNLTPLM